MFGALQPRHPGVNPGPFPTITVTSGIGAGNFGASVGSGPFWPTIEEVLNITRPTVPTIISRDVWEPIQTYTLTPFRRPITSIVMHHTAGGRSETINTIDSWHRYGVRWDYNAQGQRVYTKVPWIGGIGYHFVIGFDGQIYEGRPRGSIGTHAGERNATSLGIGIQGDFSSGSPSQAQLDSMFLLLDYLRGEIPTISRVERHASWCPGPWFDPLIPIVNANWYANRPANAGR